MTDSPIQNATPAPGMSAPGIATPGMAASASGGDAQRAFNMPLPVARADLMISPQLYLGRIVYVVKDPVSLTYFRLQPPEHTVVRHLDGKMTATQMAELVNRQFPEQETTPQDVVTFVRMLQGGGLLLGRGETYGAWLRQARDTRRRKRGLAVAMNFIFIKIPLLDPDRLLDAMHSYTRLVMNRFTATVALLFMAVSLLAGMWHLPEVGELAFPMLGWQNMLLLMGVFLVIKVIHEFGHGLAAKHRGIEVHEMGVMLMVFVIPMFYVDVSDAWMLPRRRERLWITAGGVFIEFLFAAVAVWVWLITEPGIVNQIAFNTMLAASITTLLFNANPLLRYDGYYFLMDWLQIPNLRTKAGQFTAYLAKRFILGMPDQHPPREAATHPFFMPIYAVSSGIYRWLITLSIVALVWHILDPYGLEAIGTLMAVFVIATSIGLPLLKLLRFVWSQQARTWRRLSFSLAAVAAVSCVMWGILSTTWSEVVEQPAVVLAAQRQPIFVPWEGRIEEVLVETGQRIEAGQPILRIVDEKLTDDLAQLRLERKRLEFEIAEARERQVRRGDSTTNAADALKGDALVGTVLSGLTLIQRVDERIAIIEERLEKMVVRAPFAGRFQPTLIRRVEMMIGRHVKPGSGEGKELGIMIGDVRQVAVIVPQNEASLLEEGMPVRIRLWADPSMNFTGTLESVGRDFLAEMPHDALDARYSGEVDTLPAQGYKTKPARPSVLATVTLDQTPALPIDGMTGRTRIVTGSATLGAQVWRYLRQEIFPLDWWL